MVYITCLTVYYINCCCFFFKQKTAYEMRSSDWSSDVCSSDLGMNTQRAIEIAFPAHKAPFEVSHRPRGPHDRQAVRIDIVPDRATLRLLRDRRGRDAEMPVERHRDPLSHGLSAGQAQGHGQHLVIGER